VDRAAAQQLTLFRGLALGGLLHDPDDNSGLPGGGSPATAASLAGLPVVGCDEPGGEHGGL
jgi:hypothetical protein